MTRKVIAATSLMLLIIAGLFLSSSQARGTATAAAVEPAAFALCDAAFVGNVRITTVGRSDFDILWDYTPPDACLQPSKFDVTVTVKRRNGRVRTDSKTVPGSARNVRINLAEGVFSDNEQITVNIKPTITLQPTAQIVKNF